jgi:hypothetical protein
MSYALRPAPWALSLSCKKRKKTRASLFLTSKKDRAGNGPAINLFELFNFCFFYGAATGDG